MSALEGLRVLDLTRLLPGGFCTLLLADLGADDSAKSALYLALNRGKRSLRVNLKEERGREVLLRLARE